MRLLLVEDEPSLRQQLLIALEAAGYASIRPTTGRMPGCWITDCP